MSPDGSPTGEAPQARAIRPRVIRPRGRRPSIGLVLLASAVTLVAGSCRSEPPSPSPSPTATASASPAGTPSPTPESSASPDQGAVDSWRPVPAAPIAGRSWHGAVWTGKEMIVWGGAGTRSEEYAALSDGAAFSPTTGRWRTLAKSPLSARLAPVTIWTGREVVVFGGVEGTGGGALADGARYDPAADEWKPTASFPLAGRSTSALWTGTEMFVWGGSSGSKFFNDGATYNPSSDTWTPVPESPLEPRGSHAMVWTGTEVIVWGGGRVEDGAEPEGEVAFTETFKNGARYNPKSKTWRRLAGGPESPDPSYGQYSVAWTGEAMVVWFGQGAGDERFERGARYRPASDEWSRMAVAPVRSVRSDQAEVWTGEALFVWGGFIGEGGNHSWDDGALYFPSTDSWRALPSSPLLRRSGATAVWTGTDVIVWGGSVEDWGGAQPHQTGDLPKTFQAADGAAYRP